MLELKNICKSFNQGEFKNSVLKNINLVFEDGKMYGITGVNGSGKTLISKALTGYIKLTSGDVIQNRTNY